MTFMIQGKEQGFIVTCYCWNARVQFPDDTLRLTLAAILVQVCSRELSTLKNV